MVPEPSTPLMRQYNSIKSKFPNALLLFRLGDFYELFYEDAVVAARELQITLTSRNREKGVAIPMCGVPYHAAENYIARLIHNGHRVAVCDQMEDPRLAKKLVKREVTRVITPGTASDAALLRSSENNYLGAVSRTGNLAGFAYVDISTGEFRATEVPSAEIDQIIEQTGAKEVLFPAQLQLFEESPPLDSRRRYLRTELEDWVFEFDYARRILCDHFRLHSLDGLGLSGSPGAVAAAGAILHYLRDTQKAALSHLDRPVFFRPRDHLVLDAVTVRNLELVEPLFGGPPEATLLHVLDRTTTAMGARLLRQWLLKPSVDAAEINHRLDAVEELKRETILRAELERDLARVQDLERLLARVTLGSATPRDLLALGASLSCIPLLRAFVARLRSPRLRELHERLDDLQDVAQAILSTLSDEPPLNISDGGVIRPGVDAGLDQWRDLQHNSRSYILQMEQRERARTGIQSLKVRFNNVFGYYIEISKANLHLAPADYERKQTLVNAERFTTPELKEHERKVLEAEERILEIERELLEKLRQRVAAEAQRVRRTAMAVAELDVYSCLARAAADYHYVRPVLHSGAELQIIGGRHPVIERLGESERADRFIPNDLYLNDSTDLIAVITGPNMGGKSTYLRQAALLAVMSQMGSFIPAAAARMPIIDRIFTRIGAADNLALGRSTFMVEMTETAQILNTATPSSLIILDEIGRGTATFDGLSIAWAVVEYIHQRTRAKTLFATHYHELTELAELLSGVKNLHVAVKEAGEQILFLRKVEPGCASRSYGIEVARLAGLPLAVIERARAVLERHEERERSLSEELSPAARPMQISIFTPLDSGLADQIRSLNINDLRPVEALNILSDLQKTLSEKSGC
jgi:DNA mismatch repair protein MutS